MSSKRRGNIGNFAIPIKLKPTERAESVSWKVGLKQDETKKPDLQIRAICAIRLTIECAVTLLLV